MSTDTSMTSVPTVQTTIDASSHTTIGDKKNSLSEAFSSAMSKTGEIALKALKIVGAILGSIVLIPLAFEGFRHFASDALFGTTYVEDKAELKREMETPEYQAIAGKRAQKAERMERKFAGIASHYNSKLNEQAKAEAKLEAMNAASDLGTEFDEAAFESSYVAPAVQVQPFKITTEGLADAIEGLNSTEVEVHQADPKAMFMEEKRTKATKTLLSSIKHRQDEAEKQRLAARPTTTVIYDGAVATKEKVADVVEQHPLGIGVGLGAALIGGVVLIAEIVRR